MMNSKVNNAKVIRVVQVESVAGNGTEKEPLRVITEYFSTDGELLALVDPEV